MSHDDQKLQKTDVTAAGESAPADAKAASADKEFEFSSDTGEQAPLLNLMQNVKTTGGVRKPKIQEETLDTPIAAIRAGAQTTQESGAGSADDDDDDDDLVETSGAASRSTSSSSSSSGSSSRSSSSPSSSEPSGAETQDTQPQSSPQQEAQKKGFMGGFMNKAKEMFGMSPKAKQSSEVDKKSGEKGGQGPSGTTTSGGATQNPGTSSGGSSSGSSSGSSAASQGASSAATSAAGSALPTGSTAEITAQPGEAGTRDASEKDKPAKPANKISGLFGRLQAGKQQEKSQEDSSESTPSAQQPVAEKPKQPPAEEPIRVTYAIESPERPAPIVSTPDAITRQELAAYTTSEHGAITTGENQAINTGERPASQTGEQSALTGERPAVSGSTGQLYVLVGLSDTIDPKVRSSVYKEQLLQPYSGHLSLGKATIPTGTYMTTHVESLVSIAAKHLGPGSTPANHEAYAREIQQVNGLQQATDAPPHRSLVLPGHNGDGGFMITDGNKTLIKYRDGRKTIEENADRRKRYTQELAIDGSIKEAHGGPGATGGFFVTRTRDGKAKYYEKEGSRQYKISSDTRVSLAHARLHELAEQQIGDPGGRSKFEADMAKFEDGAELRGITQEEVLHTYEQLMRLMDAAPAKKQSRSLHAPAENYAQLAQEILSQAAEPKSICQSIYSTSSVTPIEALIYAREPSKAAKLVADVGLSGTYTTADGTTVLLDIDSLKPRPLVNSSLSGDRSFATQLFNVTAINIAYRCAALRSPKQNFSPEQHYAEDEIIRSYERDNGEHIYDRIADEWQVVGHIPVLTDDQIAGVFRLISGQSLDPECGALIVHEERLDGEAKLVDKIADEQQLVAKITAMKQEGRLPALIRVHTSHEPFFTESGNDSAGGAGGWHIVTVAEFLDGLVAVDNHWHPNPDERTKVMLPHQLYIAMRSPETALDEAQSALDEMRAGGHFDVLSELDVLSLKHRTGKIDDATYGREVAQRMIEADKHWEQQKLDEKFEQKEQDTANARIEYLKGVWKHVAPDVLRSFAEARK